MKGLSEMPVTLMFYYRPEALHPAQGRGFELARTATASDVVPAGQPGGRYNLFVARMFQSDIQSSDHCQQILAAVRRVEQGDLEMTDFGGNCCSVTIRLSGVQVDYDVFDWYNLPDGRFTFEEFKIALEGWNRFLKMPKSVDSVVEIELAGSSPA